MPARIFLHASLVLCCAAAAAAPVNEDTANAIPWVDANARMQWGRYLEAREHKAYAIGRSGAWIQVDGKASADEAREAALAQCELLAFPCHLYAVNNDLVWDGGKLPRNLVERLRTRLKGAMLDAEYAQENNTSVFVGPTTRMNERYHSMTPPSIPGGKTIRTRELRDLMLSEPPPVLIDVLAGQERDSIPTALLLPGAGLAGDNPGREARFAEILQAKAPDKDAALVFFCLSYECWLSYNAALRAMKLGYRNVYWYRGGIEAWKSAKLPTLRARPLAQL